MANGQWGGTGARGSTTGVAVGAAELATAAGAGLEKATTRLHHSALPSQPSPAGCSPGRGAPTWQGVILLGPHHHHAARLLLYSRILLLRCIPARRRQRWQGAGCSAPPPARARDAGGPIALRLLLMLLVMMVVLLLVVMVIMFQLDGVTVQH